MAAYPDFIVALSQDAIYKMKRSHGMSAIRSQPQSFTLLPTSNDLQITEGANALSRALADIAGPVSLIESQRWQ